MATAEVNPYLEEPASNPYLAEPESNPYLDTPESNPYLDEPVRARNLADPSLPRMVDPSLPRPIAPEDEQRAADIQALWYRARNSSLGQKLLGRNAEADAALLEQSGVSPSDKIPNRLEQGGLLPAVIAPFQGAAPRAGKATTMAGKIAAGTYNATAGLAEGLASPVGGAALLPKVASRGVSALFAADMLGHVPEQVQGTIEATNARDIQGAIEGGLGAAASIVLGGLSATHAGGARPRLVARTIDTARAGPRVAELRDMMRGKIDAPPGEMPGLQPVRVRPEIPEADIGFLSERPIQTEPTQPAPMQEAPVGETPQLAPEAETPPPVEPTREIPRKEEQAPALAESVPVDQPNAPEVPAVEAPSQPASGDVPPVIQQPPVIPPKQSPFPGIEAEAAEMVTLNNAKLDASRAKRGLPPMAKATRISNTEMWDKAMGELAKDPGMADRLIREQSENPTVLEAWEELVIAREEAIIQDRYDTAVAKAAEFTEAGNPGEAESWDRVASDASNRLLEIDKAYGRDGSGTRIAQALAIRRSLKNERMSAAALELDWRKAHDYKKPNPDERAEFKKQADEYKAALEKEQAATAAAEARERDTALKLAESEARSAAPKIHPEILSKAEGMVRKLETAADAAWERIKVKLSKTNTGVDPTILSDLAIIGSAKIARGIVEFGRWSKAMVAHVGEWMTEEDLKAVYSASQKRFEEDVKGVPAAVRKAAQKPDAYAKVQDATEKIAVRMAAGEMDSVASQIQKLHRALTEADPKMSMEAKVDWIHNELKQFDRSFTRNDTIDAISGRGKFTLPRQDEVSRIVRDEKQQLRLIGHQQDILAGAKSLPKTGPQRDPMSTKAQIEQQKLNELIRKHGVGNKDGPEQIAGALRTRKRALENRMAIMRQEIAARKRFVETKTPSPTDAELEAMQSEYEQVKQEHNAAFPKDRTLTPEQQIEIATSHAEKSEELWAKRLAEAQKGNLWTGKKASKPFTTPEIDAIRARRDAARDAAQELKDVANRESDAMAAARKSEAEWTRRLEMAKQGKFEDGKKASKPFTTPEIEAIRARADAARDETLKLRRDTKPKKTAEEVQLSQLKARISAEAARKMDQIARNDFSQKAKRPPPRLDKEAIDAQFELNKIREKHAAQKEKWEYERLNKAQKVFTTGRKVYNTARNILTGFDDSAIGRQGGFLTKASPWRARGAFAAHLKAALSDRRMFEEHQKIALRENAVNGNYKISGLDLADFGDTATRAEEAIRASFSLPYTGIKASQRAFTAYLNVLRVDVFDALVKSLTKSGSATPEELKAIAYFINLATGRGQVGPASWKAANNAMADIIFAPKFGASRFQMSMGQPFWGGPTRGGSLRVRKLIAAEYMKYLIARGIIHALGVLAGATVTYNKLSTDSEKLKFGHMRVDPSSSFAGASTTAARLLLQLYTDKKGKTKPLAGPGVDPSGFKEGDVFTGYLRQKLAPIPQGIAEYFTGESAVGMPVTKAEALRHIFIPVPLLAKDIYEAGSAQGLSAAVVGGLASFIGESINTYDENKKRPKGQ